VFSHAQEKNEIKRSLGLKMLIENSSFENTFLKHIVHQITLTITKIKILISRINVYAICFAKVFQQTWQPR